MKKLYNLLINMLRKLASVFGCKKKDKIVVQQYEYDPLGFKEEYVKIDGVRYLVDESIGYGFEFETFDLRDKTESRCHPLFEAVGFPYQLKIVDNTYTDYTQYFNIEFRSSGYKAKIDGKEYRTYLLQLIPVKDSGNDISLNNIDLTIQWYSGVSEVYGVKHIAKHIIRFRPCNIICYC